MDFVRLAVREVKRNGSRTSIGIAAMALATVVLALSRIVPQGYMRYEAAAERVFAGADILVWPAPAHVRADDSSDLEWRPWTGEGWQSYAEYFIPSLPDEGYVSPTDVPPWRPLDTEALSRLLTQVQGVAKVEPYLSFPCRVTVGTVTQTAVLRGRDPDASLYPLDMQGLVKKGRALTDEDNGAPHALVPLVSDPSIPYFPQGEVLVSLPRAVRVKGGVEFDWNRVSSHALTAVGAYAVQLGDIPGLFEEGAPTGTSEPEYWKRPEIVVTEETFLDLVGEALGVSGDAPADLSSVPVYQLLVAVSRTSETKVIVERIREALGPGFAVYSIAELVRIRESGGGQQIVSRDMSPTITLLVLAMAAAVVAGSVYVLLALQTRKIGLLRVIGARTGDIMIYVLTIIAHTALLGAGIGFALGKLIALTVLPATGFTLLEWLRMAALDALLALSGLAVSILLGVAIAVWASGIPCAEVLRRE